MDMIQENMNPNCDNMDPNCDNLNELNLPIEKDEGKN